MKFGDKGAAVRAVQEKLIALGYRLPRSGADGHVGDETWTALRAFARDEGKLSEIAWTPEVPEDVIEALHGKTLDYPGGTVPDRAVFEAALPGSIAIYDVSEMLQKHATKRYVGRTAPITRAYAHHTGADGRDGFAGLKASVRYCVEDRDPQFPGAPYTFWLSAVPDYDRDGRIVIYRCNPDKLKTWHTGKRSNNIGVSFAFQGDRGSKPPTAQQLAMAGALMPWMVERYNLELPDGLSWHSAADKDGGRAKPSCPGRYIEAFVGAWRTTGA